MSYRGRMLISLRTEVMETADLGGPATVEVCSALPISDVGQILFICLKDIGQLNLNQKHLAQCPSVFRFL